MTTTQLSENTINNLPMRRGQEDGRGKMGEKGGGRREEREEEMGEGGRRGEERIRGGRGGREGRGREKEGPRKSGGKELAATDSQS